MTDEQPAATRGAVHPVRRVGAADARRALARLRHARRSSGSGSRRCVSSLGDWIGLIAILAIAARVSDNSGAAVSLVMTTRVLPGFLLGTVGGVIIDRFDRRKVMVLCDIGRASLLVLLPFVEQPRRAAADLARARDPHAAVGPGAGGVGAEPGAPRSSCRRRTRCRWPRATARSRSRRSSSRCSPGSRRSSATSTSSRRSRSTRKRSR